MHLVSIIILLLKIKKTRSAAGISFKSQALYTIVFVTRYLDLFTKFVSLYNTVMKAFFIGSSIYILYLMKVQFKATWDPKLDTLRYEYLLIPCAILSLIINQSFTFVEILWAFSIYLEAVAILPQLFQLTRTGEAENITIHYLGALGMYRALYIPNWIYRYYAEDHLDWIAVVSGVVQTALYSDFLYIYVTRVLKGKSFRLPA
ncbi:endoplasmic reticulum retention protein [Clydaea vesicula]|uniref:ER lumen protein-retaining receptor n=1 Tax=Clydaea vesicula TaxID=447962 RepID=A0AAD5TXH6_9FUNG|nr:endoplasmic reticulum retention protein [Clydaea vesicula]